jgi:hypothetical protein
MNLRSIVLAGATLIALAAPAAALADPEWGHDRGYQDRGYQDRGYQDRDDWRRHEWREHEGWRGYGWAPRCFLQNRGYYNWYGQYVSRRVEVCR